MGDDQAIFDWQAVNSNMQDVTWLSVLLNLLGGAAGAAVLLGALWETLAKIWTDRLRLDVELKHNKELEAVKALLREQTDKTQKLLEANIEKAVLVTRTHFETEFNAYKEIYAALCEVKYAIVSTRPVMRIRPEDESLEDRRKELSETHGQLERAHAVAVRLKENLMPFYSVVVYDQICECLKASAGEMMDIRLANERRFTSEWYNEGTVRQETFLTAFGQVGVLIRERIASLGILPQ